MRGAGGGGGTGSDPASAAEPVLGPGQSGSLFWRRTQTLFGTGARAASEVGAAGSDGFSEALAAAGSTSDSDSFSAEALAAARSTISESESDGFSAESLAAAARSTSGSDGF